MFDWAETMQCSKCRRDAIIWQRYSGLHLCREHFIVDLEAKAKREIRQKRMIASGDVIAVALSGGKDSSALLHFLTKTFGKRRDVSIIALTVDEGIAGYRDTDAARRIAEECGAPWHRVSFEEIVGTTTDQPTSPIMPKPNQTPCAELRRALSLRAAFTPTSRPRGVEPCEPLFLEYSLTVELHEAADEAALQAGEH